MRLLAVAALAAACGDNGGHGADGAPGDAFAPADARTCPPNPTGVWRDVSGTQSPFPVLDLDGIGTRCEQVLRAIPQLAIFDADVDVLLAVPHDTVCAVDEWETYVVMSEPALVNGIPVYEQPQWSTGFSVFADGSTIFGGVVLDAEYPDPACLDAVALRMQMLGHAVPYETCDDEWHEYVTAAGDIFDVTDEEFYSVTLEGGFTVVRRLRTVDITLLPAHVGPSLRNTSLDCCDGGDPVGCVGTRVWVDTSTAEIVGLPAQCPFTCD